MFWLEICQEGFVSEVGEYQTLRIDPFDLQFSLFELRRTGSFNFVCARVLYPPFGG